jgi:hypothetical protein
MGARRDKSYNVEMIPRQLVCVVLLVLIPVPAFSETPQTTFDFHNDFWVNLHHTLFNFAYIRRAGISLDLSALSSEERAVWNKALDYYSRDLIDHDLLEFQMIRINESLALAGDAPSLKGLHINPDLISQLENAAPIYRAHWWTGHQRKNQEWIDRATPLIARHEAGLKPALARAYRTSWPKGRIRVEMSYYTTNASAYTAIGPTLITISSNSQRNEGDAAVETIFHEAGHSLILKIRDEIRAEAKKQMRTLPHEDLWHAVLFYINSEIVRARLPEIVPYPVKYGMWDNAWPNTLPLLEKYWKPVLDGKADPKQAISRIVAESK